MISGTENRRRRRELAQIRYLVEQWGQRYPPYMGTLWICMFAALVFAFLWREQSFGRVWAGTLFIPVIVAVIAVIVRMREPLNWQDLIARRLEVYPYEDVTAWRDLQNAVYMAGYIDRSFIVDWLNEEKKAVLKPVRREFRFTRRGHDEGGNRTHEVDNE
ncbi:hypothetical protein PMPD1_4407 (plasmid) [Paramixta manurensis]|uniref:Uncharacterized protein n=1 Tax=Paramixta manurensis TaxID=2740817 RepID=A0A6M8UFG0_9GAMM|nr:hypothetical protein PMPD1_4407 [Erwiniaceae bacterium PD-1]